jgi:hypothetical protein
MRFVFPVPSPELDPVGNGGLHAIEEEKAAEKDKSDDGGRNDKNEAGRLAVAGDGPAKAVNYSGHGIEAVEPAPAHGNEGRRIGDGGGEHPELDEEGDDITDVAIESVERGHPEANAEGSEHGKKQQYRQPKRSERGFDAVDGGDHEEDDEADGEVHQARNNGGKREDEAWEIHLGDDALIVHDDAGAALKRGGEVGPGDERREIKNGIGEAIGRELGETAEEKSEDAHGHERLENDPGDADNGLLVADLDVAPDKEIEEFTVGPDFAEAKLEEAAGRLDANGGGSAGVERESDAGLPNPVGIGINGIRSRDGCHP